MDVECGAPGRRGRGRGRVGDRRLLDIAVAIDNLLAMADRPGVIPDYAQVRARQIGRWRDRDPCKARSIAANTWNGTRAPRNLPIE